MTLKHLAIQADVPLNLLEGICSRALDPYHIHEIRKRDRVSKRMIAAPKPDLRKVQRWLLDNVFARMPVSGYAYAYVTGRSAPECARQHVGSRWLVKLDAKDFFHEFDEVQVSNALRSVHYSPLVSLEIARIVTRHVTAPQAWLPEKYWSPSPQRVTAGIDLSAALFDASTAIGTEEHLAHPQGLRLGYLPQGSPSSGAISNILARDLDADLAALADECEMIFTRYADDITLSSSGPFDRSTAERVVHRVSAILKVYNLTPNRRKTRVVAPGLPLQVLGVRVDGDTTRLPKRMRDRIEYHLRGIERFGFSAHSYHAGFDDVLGFGNFLHGMICYAHDVDPTAAAGYFSRADTHFPMGSQAQIIQTASESRGPSQA